MVIACTEVFRLHFTSTIDREIFTIEKFRQLQSVSILPLFLFLENSLLYLDPHTNQPTVPAPIVFSEIIPDQTFHCDQPERMPLSELDPSLALVSSN